MPSEFKKPKVDYVRKELQELICRYDLIRHCIAGQDEIKKHAIKYLPQPNEADKSEENRIRYKQYKERAIFYNVTGRTLNGLVGQVFQKDTVVSLPANLDILKADVDGGGVELDQLAKKALRLNLAHGRAGLLADYPKNEGPVSIADLEAGKIRPTLSLWQPWDIINWRVKTIGSQKLLVLVVISEQYVQDDDGFCEECDDQYRVLSLNEEGNYQVDIYQETYDSKGTSMGFDVVESSIPLDGSGKPWKLIPFQFIGAENNDPEPDLPPLYDLATLNIGHYRNSADYEEACFMLGQPTPVASGLTQDWVKDVLKGSMQLGSRGIIPLPEGGAMSLLQCAPNTMPKEAMEHKEVQMVALGAKLVEQRSVQQTATEAGLNNASETSVLASCTKNVASAFTQALKWAAQFIGEAVTDDSVSYALSTDFGSAFATPQDRAQLMAEYQGNLISQTEMRDNLRRIGVAFQDDEEYKSEIDSAGPDLGLPTKAAEMKAADDAAKSKADALKNKSAPNAKA